MEKMTLEQFGDVIKKKYPEYANRDTAELATKYLEKNPVYKSKVVSAPKPIEPPKKSFLEKAGNFVGGDIANTYGGALAATGVGKQISEEAGQDVEAHNQTMDKIQQLRSTGDVEGANRLRQSLAQRNLVDPQTPDLKEIIPASEKSVKQIAGESLHLATSIAGAGSLARVPGGVSTLSKMPGLKGAVLRGATSGAKSGGLYGGLYGTAGGMEKDKSTAGIAKDAFIGSAIGGVSGGVIGGALGGAGYGAVKGYEKAKQGVEKAKQGIVAAKEKASPMFEGVTRRIENVKTNRLAREAEEGAIQQFKQPKAQEAIRQGVDIRDVGTITNTKPEVLKKSQEMLRLAEQKSKGSIVAEPRQVVGKVFRDRITAVDSARKAAGQELSKYAAAIPDEKLANVRYNVLDRIKEVPGLENAQMKLINGKHQLDFKNTLLEGDDAAIKELTDYFNTAAGKKAQGMHLYRQKLFEDLGLKSSTRVKPIESTNDKAIEAIRKGLSDTLDGANDQYKVLNKKYATLENAMKDVRAKLKPVKGAEGDILNLKLAQLSRRLTSSADADTRALLAQIEAAAKSVGFDDGLDVVQLQEILNIIDKYFDIAPQTGFSKQITKGVTESLPMSKRDLMSKALERIVEKTIDPRSSDVVRQKVIKDLIEELLTKGVTSAKAIFTRL